MKRVPQWFSFLLLSMCVCGRSNAEPSITFKNAVRDHIFRPTRIAVQRSGLIAIADHHRKQISFFDRNYRFVSSIQTPDAPLSLAFAADGNLYVGIANDVLRMTVQGAILDRFSSHGTPPQMPTGIAVAGSGMVYIADKATHRVNVFTSSGVPQFSFGALGTGNGQFRKPSGLAVDILSSEVIVADAGNSRVQIFSLQGQFQRAFGQHVEQVDSTWRVVGRFAQVQGVAVDAEHRIYVTDSGLDHVQIFSPQGTHLGFLGREGHPSTRFRVPMGIAVADSGLYVSSLGGSEMKVYTIGGLMSGVESPSIPLMYGLEQNYPNPFNPTTNIRFSLPSDDAVTLTIYDIIGREVKTVVHEHRVAGIHSVAWDGRNTAGTPVASGIYFYRLEVDNKFSQVNKMVILK
jgi:DNA-binding beta-propeller fold protein YncE